MENKISVSIILPTYNEKENIVDLALAIDNQVSGPKEIIVVDDNSPDGTSEAVAKLIREGRVPGLKLITRVKDRGLTNSIKEGISNAQGKVVVWMDCDFSMPPQLIPSLLEKVDEGYDVAVGSRFVKGGSFKKDTSDTKDSWLAVLLSRVLNLFIRFVLDSSFKDYTSGFIAIKKEVLDKIDFSGDYGEYFIELIFKSLLLGYKVVEIPYVCLPRAKGESKTGANLPQYIKRGWRYVNVALRLFVIRIKYKLFGTASI